MVVIKDFEMPTSCSECIFCDVHSQCVITGFFEDDDYTESNRSEDYPLAEIEGGKIDKGDK